MSTIRRPRLPVVGLISLVALAVCAMTAPATAQPRGEDPDKVWEYRIVGFDRDGGHAELEGGAGNAGLIYFVWFLVSMVPLGVMFKNAKRTHLD